MTDVGADEGVVCMIRHIRFAVLVHADEGQTAAAEHRTHDGTAVHGDVGVATHTTGMDIDSEFLRFEISRINQHHVTASLTAAEHVAVKSAGGLDTDLGVGCDVHVGIASHVTVFTAAVNVAIHIAVVHFDFGVENIAVGFETVVAKALTSTEHVTAVRETDDGV